MSVSRRLRFEILRRDNHTCRYCGQSAPDVKLTVDHVQPVALGGLDDPSNLVTACQDCNAGKSSIAPGSPLVAQVNADHERWALAMRATAEVFLGEFADRRAFCDWFYEAWHGWTISDEPVPLPSDWEASILRWKALNVPVELIAEALRTAMNANHVDAASRFRYMAGIVWNQVSEMQDTARSLAAKLAADDPTEF